MTWSEGSPTIGRIFSPRLEEVFGPAREPQGELTKHHEDVAGALQAVLEEAYLHVVNEAHRRTGMTNLCLAGGVALNAVANGRIRPETAFDGSVHPARGRRQRHRRRRRVLRLEPGARPAARLRDGPRVHGPEYSDAECARALRAAGLASEVLDDDALFRTVAERIAAGDVVGWFQGRMEFGPRALGNRSIVADPRRHDMKDILNARIKHREPFRPFAPSMLAERTGEWYEQDYTSPFMMLVYKTRPTSATRSPPSTTSTTPAACRPSSATSTRATTG